MATIRRFEDIECWQEARILTRNLYDMIKNDHFKKDFELVAQVKRSAISSMANIDESELTRIKNQAEIVWKKVNSFITYLQKVNKKTK